jgi:hypothetical protein
VVLYCLILNFLATARIRLFTKCDPWSVNIAFGAPYTQITSFTNASATFIAFVSLSGIAIENFDNRSCAVSMYQFPEGDIGSDPMISMDIFSNAASRMSVNIMGCFVLTLTFSADF